MSLRSMLTDTCTRRRLRGGKSTATGGYTTGKTFDSCDIPCAIQAAGASESLDRRQIVERTSYTGYFEHGVDILPTDHLIWRGKTLRVISGPLDRAGRRNHAEYGLEETRPDA